MLAEHEAMRRGGGWLAVLSPLEVSFMLLIFSLIKIGLLRLNVQSDGVLRGRCNSTERETKTRRKRQKRQKILLENIWDI